MAPSVCARHRRPTLACARSWRPARRYERLVFSRRAHFVLAARRKLNRMCVCEFCLLTCSCSRLCVRRAGPLGDRLGEAQLAKWPSGPAPWPGAPLLLSLARSAPIVSVPWRRSQPSLNNRQVRAARPDRDCGHDNGLGAGRHYCALFRPPGGRPARLERAQTPAGHRSPAALTTIIGARCCRRRRAPLLGRVQLASGLRHDFLAPTMPLEGAPCRPLDARAPGRPDVSNARDKQTNGPAKQTLNRSPAGSRLRLIGPRRQEDRVLPQRSGASAEIHPRRWISARLARDPHEPPAS